MPEAMVDLDVKPVRNPDVHFRRLEKYLVLILAAQPYQLNETAEAAWMLCDGERTLEAIATEVRKEFDADQVQVRGDLVELFTELVGYGIVSFDR